MKRLVILFLALSPAMAYTDIDSLVINYGGYNTINVIHDSPNAEVVELDQVIYWSPQDGEIIDQELQNLSLNNGFLLFHKEGDFSESGWYFNITVNNSRSISFVEINPGFPYPTSSFSEEIKQYLGYSQYIDSNNDLKYQADKILTGVSDYLTAVLLLGEWVYNNIDYEFSEPYSTSVLSASEVLAYGQGVCDEHAVLFMSLARSVGIPCRLVTGNAFGNVLGLNGFGPHAWVEVYVPNHGWIGMDPTYGQFGWFDATHLGFAKTWNYTNDFISTTYTAKDIDNVGIVNNFPNFMSSSFSFGTTSSAFSLRDAVNETKLLSVFMGLGKRIVAEQEYFLLNVSISNPFDYFIPLSFNVISTSSMEFINSSHWQPVLLKPRQTVTSYLILRAPVLGYHVAHPIEVYVPMAGSFDTEVEVRPSYTPKTSLEELLFITTSEREFIEGLSIKGISLVSEVSYDFNTDLLLSVENTGNSVLNNLTVIVNGSLIDDASLIIDWLGINAEQNISIPLNITSLGEAGLKVSVIHGNETAVDGVFLVSAVNPDLSLDYDGEYSFSSNPEFFLEIINPNELVIPELNVTINAPRGSISKSFLIGSNETSRIDTGFPESWLVIGENEVIFKMDYIDEHNTEFSHELNVTITREGEWWEVFIDGFNGFLSFIVEFFGSIFS